MNSPEEKHLVLRQKFQRIWVEGADSPVLMPESTEDVMAIVNWCRENSWKVLPIGRGTSFKESYEVPFGVLTILSSARNGVSDPDPRDLVIEVESGTGAEELAIHVENSGFKLDSWPKEYKGTVGGLFSGSKGIQVRHLILGMDIVDGTGRSMRFGGRVRKNVAGLDISGFFTGSFGILGWIDRLYLKLTPLAAQDFGFVPSHYKTQKKSISPIYKSVLEAIDPDQVFFKVIG